MNGESTSGRKWTVRLSRVRMVTVPLVIPAPFVDLALEPREVLKGGPEVVVDEAAAVGQSHPVGTTLE